MAVSNAMNNHEAGAPPASCNESAIVRQMTELVDSMTLDETPSPSTARDIAECLQLFSQSSQWTCGSIDADGQSNITGFLTADALEYVETSFTNDRFQVRRMLGHGGFGVVLLAFDKRLGRDVALKLPRPEILASHSIRERFLREAQAAAALDHPNIVPVYDTGELGPSWFITSRYIEGPTLAEWLHQQSSPVAPKWAAELVSLLADAVQHAHSRGVLHCDLKPANVLLEPIETQPDRKFPFVPRLSDFGLARYINECDPSRSGNSLVGTPRYMAPEQAACRYKDIDIQTDVYGLGVILFELLTGEPPFAGHDDKETLRQIVADAVPIALLTQHRTPQDLRATCLKSLAKDSSQRYATAAAFAADLRSFLHGEPVQARPVGRAERAALWCRRRPLQAALSAALCLITVLGIAGIMSQWIRAEQNLVLARKESLRAEANLHQVELSFIDLAWVFEEAELWSGRNSVFPALMADKLQRYVDDILPQYVASEKVPQPILAALYAMNARSFSRSNQTQAAEEYYRKSIDLWRKVLQHKPESAEFSRALAITLFGYANHLLSSGAVKNDDPNTNVVQSIFANLKLPPEDEFRAMRAYVDMLTNLGHTRIGQQRIPEALAAFEQAQQAYHELGQRSQDAEFRASEALTLSAIAVNQRRFLKDLPRAIKNANQARRIMEAAVEQEPERLKYRLLLAHALHIEGKFTFNMRKPDQAAALYERAIQLQEEWVRNHPLEYTEREQYGNVSLELAQKLNEWKRPGAALPYYQLAAKQWESLIPIDKLSQENRYHLPMVYFRIGEEQERSDNPPEAITAFRRSIELADIALQNPKAPRKAITALIQSNVLLANVLHRTGALAEAASCLRRAITILQQQLVYRPDNLNFKQQLADAQTKLAELESKYEKANSKL